MLTGSLEGELYPGLLKKLSGQKVKGGDSALLLRPCETPVGVLHPPRRSSTQERHGSVGVGPEEDHKDDQRVRAPLLQRQAERTVIVQHGEEKAWKDFTAVLQYLKCLIKRQ